MVYLNSDVLVTITFNFINASWLSTVEQYHNSIYKYYLYHTAIHTNQKRKRCDIYK